MSAAARWLGAIESPLNPGTMYLSLEDANVDVVIITGVLLP